MRNKIILPIKDSDLPAERLAWLNEQKEKLETARKMYAVAKKAGADTREWKKIGEKIKEEIKDYKLYPRL